MQGACLTHSPNQLYRSPDFRFANQVLKTYSIDTNPIGDITYRINSQGYRSDEFNKQSDFKLLAIGCSSVFGTGVAWEATFSWQFANAVSEDFAVFNLSMTGASNDYISRILLGSYDVLLPDFVLVNLTYPNRKEFVSPDGNFMKIHLGQEYETENERHIAKSFYATTNDHLDMINFRMNLRLIYEFLVGRKATFIVTTYRGSLLGVPWICPAVLSNDGGARDRMHAGVAEHTRFAKELLLYAAEKNILSSYTQDGR